MFLATAFMRGSSYLPIMAAGPTPPVLRAPWLQLRPSQSMTRFRGNQTNRHGTTVSTSTRCLARSRMRELSFGSHASRSDISKLARLSRNFMLSITASAKSTGRAAGTVENPELEFGSRTL
jgi:hypothetical protein